MTVRSSLAPLAAFCLIHLATQESAASPRDDGLAPLPDALARGGSGDGVYGRFNGALALALGAGAELAPSGPVARPLVHAALRFYQTAGLTLSFTQAVTDSDPFERSLAPAIVLEPLFLLRWSADRQWGRAFWDLTLDSLSISIGAVVAEPRGGTFGDAAGCRFGLGAGVPLLAKANGPWLRFGGRLDTGIDPNLVGTVFAELEWQWFFHGRTAR